MLDCKQELITKSFNRYHISTWNKIMDSKKNTYYGHLTLIRPGFRATPANFGSTATVGGRIFKFGIWVRSLTKLGQKN